MTLARHSMFSTTLMARDNRTTTNTRRLFGLAGVLAIVYVQNLTIVVQHFGRNPFAPAGLSVGLRREERKEPMESVGKPSLLDDTRVMADHQIKESSRKPGQLNGNVTILVKMPPPQERAPGFIIIGAQKGGTQALRKYLSKNPFIEMPTKVVETHFWNEYYDPLESPEENLKAYMSQYFHRNCGKTGTLCMSGESTPIYLYDTKNVPARVREACKWVKLIVVLRDPVKRAFSHYNMLSSKNEIYNTTFKEHLDLELKWMKEVGIISNSSLSKEEEDDAWLSYLTHKRWQRLMLGRGLYEIQLRAWFQHFPRDQFLILRSDELQDNHALTMRRVYQFLGLAEHEVKKILKVHVRNYSSPASDELETFLYDFYRPYNMRLEGLLGPEWKGVWEKASS